MNFTGSHESDNPAKRIKMLAEGAEALAKSGDAAGAEQIYRQILAIAPYHLHALQFLAGQAYAAGNVQEALSLTNRAIETAPNTPLLHLNRAMLYQHLGKLNEALVSLNMALELHPRFPLALLSKALLLKDMGQREEAIHTAIAAWRMLPNPEVLANDESIPLPRRTLVKEAANLIRATQLAMVDAELQPSIEKYGKQSLERLFAAVTAYAGLQTPQSTHDSQLNQKNLVIPGLSAQRIRSASQQPWYATLLTTLPAVRDAAARIFDEFKPGLQGTTASHPGVGALGKPLVHNIPSSQNRADMEPALAALFDILPLQIDPGIPTGISLILLPPGNHVIGRDNGGNWKLTAYMPLALGNPATLTVESAVMQVMAGECLLISEQFEHVFETEGPDTTTLLSFAVMHPDLSSAEIEGLLAVLRAFRHFHSRYLRP